MKLQPAIKIPDPELQIDFCKSLGRIREACLDAALRRTVAGLEMRALDGELAALVPQRALNALAQRGLRGELLFPVPCLLKANPQLLGYYRLLLGFSQKAFYSSSFGVSGFKAMEEKGVLSKSGVDRLIPLCAAMIASSAKLLDGIGASQITQNVINDLTLLILGAQLRGGENVKKGGRGIIKVLEMMKCIVSSHIAESTANRLLVKNAAGREVLIEFAADPDIIIRERISGEDFRNIIAIEIKSGTDFSNIHNRIGEAEKATERRGNSGYVECWTVVNVNAMDLKKAGKESPSTDRFYLLSRLENTSSPEYRDFRGRLIGLIGIPDRPAAAKHATRRK